jgi:hypothetical protein
MLLVIASLSGAGQEKKPENKDGPRILVVLPLGAAPGATTRVTIRGLKLDAATAVRFQEPKASAKIVSKGKAAVSEQFPAPRIGDTQIVADVTLPAGVTAGSVAFTIVTPTGESPPHSLLLESTIPVVAEKEPNNGFSQAQAIQIPQVVEGCIREPKDVDVFRFQGKAGQRLVCEVLAARHGSPLDSVLTVYDAAGRQVACNDDVEGSTDSRLEVTLPRTGAYYLTVIDANDQGSEVHVYRLVVKPAR